MQTICVDIAQCEYLYQYNSYMKKMNPYPEVLMNFSGTVTRTLIKKFIMESSGRHASYLILLASFIRPQLSKASLWWHGSISWLWGPIYAALIVTEEQRDAIAKLYQENRRSFSTISNNQDKSRILIPQSETDPECQYCLYRPCITNECNRQLWWEHHNHVPSDTKT